MAKTYGSLAMQPCQASQETGDKAHRSPDSTALLKSPFVTRYLLKADRMVRAPDYSAKYPQPMQVLYRGLPHTPAGVCLRSDSYAQEDGMTQLPRSEYPRPQFVRDAWMNLNGLDRLRLWQLGTGA